MNLVVLYSLVAGLNFITAISIVYYVIAVRPEKKVLYLFIAHKLLDTLAVTGMALFYTQYKIMPFYACIYIVFFSWAIQSISVVSYENHLDRRFGIYVIILTCIFSLLYLVDLSTDKWTVYMSDTYGFILFSSVGYRLISRRKHYKIPLLLGVCYIVFAAINALRVLSIIYAPEKYDFFQNNIVDTLYFLIILALIVLEANGFLLLLSEVDKKDLFEQYRLNQVALEQSPLSIVIVKNNGIISYVNPATSHITGYQANEVLGKTPSIFKSGQTSKEIYTSLWKTITSGNMWFGEFINRKKNGELYIEEVAISPLKNTKGEIDCYFAIKADITTRKKNEELILEQNSKLSELNDTKNKLFSIIAHDLRNPIGAVMTLLELANNFKDEGNADDALDMISVAKDASKSSYTLLENLLNWSRSQLNAVSVNFTPVSIHEIATEIIALNQISLTKKQIEVTLQIKNNAQITVDKDMFKSIIRNLFSNAIKFTPSKGNIEISSIQNNNEVIISIKDSGIGIEPSRLTKLFSFTENKSTYGTAGETGTGLGLVLANDFVIKNNGRLWVESTIKIGTTFYIAFPISNQ